VPAKLFECRIENAGPGIGCVDFRRCHSHRYDAIRRSLSSIAICAAG
jgi:hypothetical protein